MGYSVKKEKSLPFGGRESWEPARFGEHWVASWGLFGGGVSMAAQIVTIVAAENVIGGT